MKIRFATENRAKLEEARQALSRHGIEVEGIPLKLAEPDGGTVSEVARFKLEQVRKLGMDHVMVDDAGLFFKAWPGFPGVLTKRIFDKLGYRGFAKLLDGESREAWFEGAVAVCWDGDVRVFTGVTAGMIAELKDSLKPVPGFPFDPVFVPEGESRPLAELSEEERLVHSYRRKALEQLADWILTKTGKDTAVK
ncbi:non-canonical purine NTP pyrophosphatase [Staphylospora marina]|uniref:non-canonical purine NTP pyrophosphatase n=1 Tax=Staphylospora marina TaxID=2490858 RepID=UPI0013DE20D1|nr:non-canonical purine NTP pyrophosphatase [Staphylospora marina]